DLISSAGADDPDLAVRQPRAGPYVQPGDSLQGSAGWGCARRRCTALRDTHVLAGDVARLAAEADGIPAVLLTKNAVCLAGCDPPNAGVTRAGAGADIQAGRGLEYLAGPRHRGGRCGGRTRSSLPARDERAQNVQRLG